MVNYVRVQIGSHEWVWVGKQSQVKMELPGVIGDYTDFFSSKEHAVNCGTLFKSKEEALPPNWYSLLLAFKIAM